MPNASAMMPSGPYHRNRIGARRENLRPVLWWLHFSALLLVVVVVSEVEMIFEGHVALGCQP